MHPDDLAEVVARVNQAIQTGVPVEHEWRLVRPDGTVRWVTGRFQCFRDSRVEPLRLTGVNIDITERRQTGEALQESERRLRLALDAGRMGTWEWSIDTGRVVWSPSLEAIHGLPPGSFEGTFEAYQKDMHPEDAELVRSSIARSLDTGDGHHVEYRIVWPDGSVHWVEARGTLVRSGDGTPTGMLGICSDVTERKQIEADLRAANRLKDEFLATLSHELRTPLHAVLGWARMLRSGTLRPDLAARAFESLERNARAQVQLVDDLLDMSRIVSGKLEIRNEVTDLAAVVAGAIDAVRPAAMAKGVSLDVAVDGAGRVAVSGDPDRLGQIAWNLLANAVKFTPPGGSVSVSLERRDSQAEIVVRDTGEGIDRRFLPYVFDRFRQADGATTRRHGGLGLGLAIVRHLTEAHGGTVTAASDGPGTGATFTVRLPLTVEKRTRTKVHERQAGGNRFRDTRVLVVDDEPDARELIRAVLESEAADVSVAESAQEALLALQNDGFDVLVADIGMPERDGFWLIQMVRQLADPQRQILALAVTAYAGGRERDRALAVGYDRHLAKPVAPDDLVKAVAEALAGRRAGGSIPPEPAARAAD